MMILLTVISISNVLLLLIGVGIAYIIYFHIVQKNYTIEKKGDINKKEETEEVIIPNNDPDITIDSVNGKRIPQTLEQKIDAKEKEELEYARYLYSASASGEITLTEEEMNFVKEHLKMKKIAI